MNASFFGGKKLFKKTEKEKNGEGPCGLGLQAYRHFNVCGVFSVHAICKASWSRITMETLSPSSAGVR
jgi:hypothetical protein